MDKQEFIKIITEGDLDWENTPSKERFEIEVFANKYLRKSLDKHLQQLQQCPRSRERSLAITKLQESIMWLGQDLARLNTPNPYPDSMNTDNTKIEPTADKFKK